MREVKYGGAVRALELAARAAQLTLGVSLLALGAVTRATAVSRVGARHAEIAWYALAWARP